MAERTCPRCEGTGIDRPNCGPPEKCRACNGTGIIKERPIMRFALASLFALALVSGARADDAPPKYYLIDGKVVAVENRVTALEKQVAELKAEVASLKAAKATATATTTLAPGCVCAPGVQNCGEYICPANGGPGNCDCIKGFAPAAAGRDVIIPYTPIPNIPAGVPTTGNYRPGNYITMSACGGGFILDANNQLVYGQMPSSGGPSNYDYTKGFAPASPYAGAMTCGPNGCSPNPSGYIPSYPAFGGYYTGGQSYSTGGCSSGSCGGGRTGWYLGKFLGRAR